MPKTPFLPSIKSVAGYASAQRQQDHGPPSPPHPSEPPSSSAPSRFSVPHSLCVDLLVEGNVTSFNEFFFLTHRKTSDPHQSAENSNKDHLGEIRRAAYQEKTLLPPNAPAPSEPVIDPETGEEADVALRKYKVDTLLKFKELLTNVEKCQREGNSQPIYDAQKAVANYFQDLGLPTLAIRYHQAALESAKRVTDKHSTEIEASSNLGGALETQGELFDAVNCYEKSRGLAKDVGNSNEEQASTRKLLAASVKIAEEHERRGDFEKAMNFYQQCLDVIMESFPEDYSALGDLHFRMGRTLFQRKDFSDALQFYESFLKCSQTINDDRKQAFAHAGLSRCYENLGDLRLAVSHLVSFSQLAEGMGQRKAQAEAQHRLGLLYGKMGAWEKASECLEVLYELVSALYVEASNAESDDGGDRTHEIERKKANHEDQADSWSLEPAVDAVAVKEGSAGVNIVTVQTMLGIARMQAQSATYLRVVAEAGPKEMMALLRWKSSGLAMSGGAVYAI